MLIDLLTTDDDVAGFGGGGPWGGPGIQWPGLVNLGISRVASTATTNRTGLTAHELTHVIGGGDAKPKD